MPQGLTVLILASALLQQPQTPAAPAPAAAPASVQAEDPAVTALALKIYAQMRAGKVDGALLTPEMAAALTPAALEEKKPIFDQLGDPEKLEFQKSEKLASGTRYEYLATFAAAQLHVRLFIDTAGKVAGYFLAP